MARTTTILLLLVAALCCPTGTSGLGFIAKKGTALKPTPSKADKAPVVKAPPPAPAPAPKPDPVSSKAAVPIAGVLTVLGGSVAHLTLGSLYIWGNLQTYLPGHLRFFDGKVHPGATDAQLVLPMTILAQCIGLPLGPAFQKLVGERFALLIGSWLMASGVFLSSYATTLPLFMVFYSLLFGVGVGLAYTAPIVAGWKWFPQSKGLVSGAVLTGFGAGGFIFTKLGTAFINPDNLQAKGGFFPDSVHEALGPGLRKLALCYFALSAVGSALVSTPPPSAPAAPQRGRGKDVKAVESGEYTPAQAVVSGKFWLLWSIIFLVAGGSLSTAGLCKAFGTLYKELNSDAFLSMVVALSALFNGGGRLFWGSMSDKLGFKKAFLALSAIQTVTLGLYDKLTASRFTFGLGTMSVFFTLGGTFSMFPPLITQVFGAKNGVTIYGYIFTAFAAASILGSLVAKQLVATVGWDHVFKIFALCSGGAFGLATLLAN